MEKKEIKNKSSSLKKRLTEGLIKKRGNEAEDRLTDEEERKEKEFLESFSFGWSRGYGSALDQTIDIIEKLQGKYFGSRWALELEGLKKKIELLRMNRKIFMEKKDGST